MSNPRFRVRTSSIPASVMASFLAMIIVLGAAATVSAFPESDTDGGDRAADNGSPQALLARSASAEPLAKIDAHLRPAAEHPQPDREHIVIVTSDRALDLSSFGTAHQFRWPAGEHVAILTASDKQLASLASLDGVVRVESGDPDIQRPSPGDSMNYQPAIDYEAQAEAARNAPPWKAPSQNADTQRPALNTDIATSSGDGATPQGWFDVRDNHAGMEAWDLGYRGEGVRVAVLDYTVDFAHPDLQDTWATLPEGHPYEGWPQAYDPYSTYLLSLEVNPSTNVTVTTDAAASHIALYQDSTVEEREIDGEMTSTACFEPLYYNPPAQGQPASNELGEEMCDYIVPESMGGEVRFGHHQEAYLRQLPTIDGGRPEWAGVLIVDANEAGTFDTVYVDLDNDHDFTDEKPVSKESPLSWRDTTGDDIADVTGGLLTYISDGELPVPGAWTFGIEDYIPEAGRMVTLQIAEGGHGTLCASNIVSQGRLGLPDGAALDFRDLGGPPESMNFGLAPDAELVTIGSVYAGPIAVFRAAWRYSVIGHDMDNEDDHVQITSNSYGFSGTDHDGWDEDSRLIDHYIQTYSPSTSFLASTGNGAPGYGTLAPPSPAVGLGIAASTQMGSTGYDSITDTNQITYGDIIPFSNRGPGADGRNGPSVAADGAYAAGASPINGYGDGTQANGTWGGTSRSSPVAAGVMALVYESFLEKHGEWPNWEEAKSILMSGARFAGYDTLIMGAGVVDAGDSARIGGGHHGLYAMPPEWQAGDYRGQEHEAFANIIAPGGSDVMTFTLRNPSDAPIDAELMAQQLRRIGSETMDLELDRREAGPSSSAGANHLVPVDRDSVPEGTDLMVVRGVVPMDQFDPTMDYQIDNSFSINTYQHTDIDGDGELWNDRNGDGIIDLSELGDTVVTATWETGDLTLGGTEGGITVPLEPEGITGDLGWFGRACNGDDQIQDVEEKIALVERGQCTFQEKLINVQDAGAVAMLIFTDGRNKTAMGGDNTGVTIPGVMIDRAPGLSLAELLETGQSVEVSMAPSSIPSKGLGVPQLNYEVSELDEYEYMRFSQDSSNRNNWEVSVHHPLERWADGIYIGISHLSRSDAITITNMTLRIDYYDYETWEDVDIDQSAITVPANGEITFAATINVPEEAAFGTHQGAIMVDYGRGEGDEPVGSEDGYAGGYEVPQQRTVIPVVANVAPTYEWDELITLGGEDADDRDAPYNLGAVRGRFNWSWRAESGDWRFFFIDAMEPPQDAYWLFRTQWDDAVLGQSDIDTRVYGPSADRLSDPDHPANEDEDWSNPEYFGPYALDLLTRSPYLYRGGGQWTHQTSSSMNDDWLAAPAGEGLHEVMLHNVLFSGQSIEMPFQTQVGALTIDTSEIKLYGDACTTFEITSQVELPEFTARGFGMSEPTVLEDQPISQDDPDDRSSASFKYDVTLDDEAGRFRVELAGEDDDDLDLFLLRDANGDGEFTYPQEAVAEGTSPDANEEAAIAGFAPAGNYQIWVQGWSVEGDDSTFDITIDIVSGDDIQVENAPDVVPAGEPTSIEVCVDPTSLEGAEGPRSGILTMGPGGAPRLIQLPVTWESQPPTIYLPMAVKDHALRMEEMDDGEGGDMP